jgi:TetR/AcrR family transcriptional regulator
MNLNTTEQAILDAAETLFLEKGYAATSTVQIAKLAGCNQALVHYYFRSKQNLFGIVFRNKATKVIKFVLQIGKEEVPFIEKMRQRVEAHFEFIRSNQQLPVLFFSEISANKDLIREILAEFSTHVPEAYVLLQEELNDAFEKGSICKTEPIDLIFRVFSVNVMTFMMLPLVQIAMDLSDEARDQFLESRKQANIETILKTLKP